ncbi:helix-turn-helix domain-containing protein [Streptomyces sp. NPDC102365]|uniref:helix-turn-helix domain-containing protein n=1 Tax=Streptomyces sp. NPDC102365 TaxID=3366162 RepID=UPI0037FE4166
MLRQWRRCCVSGANRTTLEQAGVQSIGRRRVPGLRREELGRLAGVSADYIERLEQGQGHPSREVLEALARALRLGRDDYEYFCVLVGYSLTGDGYVPPTHRWRRPTPARPADRRSRVCLRRGLDGDRMEQRLEFRAGLRAGPRPRT